MTLGISPTQVTQLVAQKFTSVTRPFRSAVVRLDPSSRTKVEAGAASALVARSTPAPAAIASAAPMPKRTIFMQGFRGLAPSLVQRLQPGSQGGNARGV